MNSNLVSLIVLGLLIVAAVVLRKFRHRLADAREWTRQRLLTAASWLIWSPWRIGGLVAVVIVALIVIGVLHSNQPRPAPTSPQHTASAWPEATAEPETADSSSASARTQSASPTSTATTASPSATSSSAQPKHLSGDALGRAWITGFLTRTSPTSNDWATAIAPMSTADLVSTLQEQSDKLGISLSGPWKVAKIARYTPPNPVADTPVRHQMAYIVTITNGHHTMHKPFILTAYLGGNGWQIASAEQPYTSNG